MVFSRSLVISILVGVSACSSFSLTRVMAAPDTESGVVELNSKLEEFSTQHGITGKDLARLKSNVLVLARTRERLSFQAIGKSCGVDIQTLCSNDRNISATLQCIKSKRDLVSEQCETALRKEFGGKPTLEAQLFRGIPIPTGSIYRYDHHGNVSGVVVAENIEFNGIHFKKGSISFNNTGISVGRLVSDQHINGIEYLASGLGPFFNENGDIVNATLASDTEIDGIVYMGGQQITFHSKGRVKSGRVAQETTVQGESYIPGDTIWFDPRGVIRPLNKLNLYKPKREPIVESSEYLGRTFITSRPLAYQVGLPRRNQASRYIRDNSFTIISGEVDRRITNLRNNCIGCIGPDRITTPIRIQYIPVGTSITVVSEYPYKSDSFSRADIRMLIVKDEHGNSAEISELAFKHDIATSYTGKESRVITNVVNNIESFKKYDKLELTFCTRKNLRNSPDPARFMSDFQMEAEVDITPSDAYCDGGYLLEFKTLESYLTSNYYFREWGFFGKWWNKNSTPPKLPLPQFKPRACAPIKLNDIRKSGNCPGPQCNLSKLCKPIKNAK